MKKITKFLLIISFICFSSYNVVYAQDNDIAETIDNMFQDKTWVRYGIVKVNNIRKIFDGDFSDMSLDKDLKDIFDEQISIHSDIFDESYYGTIKYRDSIMMSENPNSNVEIIAKYKPEGFDSYINPNDSGTLYKIIDYNKDLNIIDTFAVYNGKEDDRRTIFYEINNEIYQLYDDNGELSIEKHLPIDSPELNELKTFIELDKDSYPEIDYDDIMRERDGRAGDKVYLYKLDVVEYEERDNVGYILLKNWLNDDEFYYAELSPLLDYRLIEDDEVDIYGVLDEPYTYEYEEGLYNTVPKVNIDVIIHTNHIGGELPRI